MEALEKLQEKLKELEEFSKLAPAHVEVKVNDKTYFVPPPTLYVVNTVEKKFAMISLERLKVAQNLTNEAGEAEIAKLVELLGKNIDVAAEIVQVILDGKPTDKHVVSKETLMQEWTVFDLVKVFKAYEYLVDVSDFFKTFRIPIARL